MAGSIVPAKIEHRARGVVRTDVVITTDAAGAPPADTVVGVGFGRLVGVAVKGPLSSAITIKDTKSGAVILNAYRPTTAVFGNTTTGDTTAGAAEDLFTTGAAHSLSAGDMIIFTAKTQTDATNTEIFLNTPYYVAETTGAGATTFCLSPSLAESAAGEGQVICEIGDSDISASTWYKEGAAVTAAYFRPTGVVTTNAGAPITGHADTPKTNRDIYVGGKVSLSCTGGEPSHSATVSLIIDEVGLGEIANTI